MRVGMAKMKSGDGVGFCGYSPLSLTINVGTGGLPFWPFDGISHIGTLARYKGQLELFECTTLDNLPCLIQGRPVKGTQCVHLEERIDTYRGRVFHFPLYRRLYEAEVKRLSEFFIARIGRGYDALEAFEAGGCCGLLYWLSRPFHPPSRAYFCSKESAAGWSDCGICPMADARRWNPNRLIRHLRRHEILLPPVQLK